MMHGLPGRDEAGELSCCRHVAGRRPQTVAPVGQRDEGQAHPERGDEPGHGVHQLHVGVDGSVLQQAGHELIAPGCCRPSAGHGAAADRALDQIGHRIQFAARRGATQAAKGCQRTARGLCQDETCTRGMLQPLCAGHAAPQLSWQASLPLTCTTVGHTGHSVLQCHMQDCARTVETSSCAQLLPALKNKAGECLCPPP